MSLGFVLLVVLGVLAVGGLPTWPHSRHWGYYPSAGMATIFVIALIFVLGPYLAFPFVH